MKMRIFLGVAIGLLLLISTAFSHDYWLEPERFFIPADGSVKVRMYLGEGFKSEEERPLQKERTIRFQMFSAGETQDLLAAGNDNQTPVAEVKLGTQGNYLVAMERKAQTIKLESLKFTGYLVGEGLDSIIALREQLGETYQEGRERYRRYLKALFQAGNKHDSTYKRVVGQRLEILPQSNPYGMKPGDMLRVLILFEGKPLGGAKVFAYNQSGGEVHEQSARTAKDGIVALKLDRMGEWLIRLVHMRRCAADCAEIDWESFWGAYSFGMK